MRIALIPARGGSRRVPRKALKLFHGKPAIIHAIELAQRSSFNAIVVSTEDAEIAGVARTAGAIVLDRPKELAEDGVGTQSVAMHACASIDQAKDAEVCVLYPVTPLVLPADLLCAHNILVLRPAGYVVAVAADPLRDIGNFYWGRGMNFIAGSPLYDFSTAMYVMPPDRACDVNTPEDWLLAEAMYAKLHGGSVNHERGTQ